MLLPIAVKPRSLVAHVVAGEGQLHGTDRLVRALVARVEIDAERRELAAQVAGSDAQDHPAAGQHVEAQDGFRGQEGVAVRQHHDVGLQAQRRRRGGRERQGHEGVERVMPATVQPAMRRERVVGHVAGIEARVLGGTRDLGDGRLGHELGGAIDTFGGQGDGVAHDVSSGWGRGR